MLSIAAGIAGAVGVGYLSLKIFCPWVLKDIQYIKTVLPAANKLKQFCEKKQFIADLFEEKVEEQPDKVLVIFEDKTYTYRFINEQANRVARAALQIGIKRGDTVALMCYNEPAFLWTFVGFMKIGVTAALVNYNQRSKTLLHSLIVAGAKYIIIGDGKDLVDAVAEVIDDLPETNVYVQGCAEDELPKSFRSFHDVTNSMSAENVDKDIRKDVEFYEAAVCVFTSGTTGLPKAAVVSQKKILAGVVATQAVKLNKEDTVMITLPLYHSSALVIGFASVVCSGASLILCRKFSASNFWNICRKHKATIILYIGELCRYLLAVPPNKLDTKHNVRVAIGNGLRQDIYLDFKRRFGIPWIAEFYASTEGPLGFINCLNVTGACGRHSPILNNFLFAELVQYDVEKEAPVRNTKGFCIPVKRRERGLLLSKINEKQTYDGYKGRKELTESKIVRPHKISIQLPKTSSNTVNGDWKVHMNVSKEGDKFFNTGDLFILDDEYNMYFNDRVGDTFRWKGENVSTTEVSNILTDLDFISDACVYGVPVPGHDGKAGMAALLLDQGLTTLDESALSRLSAHCTDNFPVYERPIFLRVPRELEMTSTIKQNKMIYKEEAFDKTQIVDEMYYYDKDEEKYKSLTDEVYKQIMDKEFKI